MTALLASVRDREEALLAMQAGADILDLKNPDEGALGALPLPTIREIVDVVDEQVTISATIGDLPMQPERVVFAIEHTSAQGVGIVKAGFFGSQGHEACIQAIQPLARKGIRVVAVLFADQAPDFSLLPKMKTAGFFGVMLDTARKDGKRLRDWLDESTLREFLKTAQALDLKTGLAGSLALEDIPLLTALQPDYLGFRGALCERRQRCDKLSESRVREAEELLRECNINKVNAGWA